MSSAATNQPSLVVALPPHERSTVSVGTIMWNVALALVPAMAAALWFHGIRSLVVTAVAVASCVLVEHLVGTRLLKRPYATVTDGSAVVTGILLAFNLPVGIPLWQVIVGSAVAIGVAKMAFGGIGNNPFNPALVGRAFMLISFPVDMTTWPVPRAQGFFAWDLDAVTAATPLALSTTGAELPSHLDLFLGAIGGCIGEVSALAVILGGLYLVWRGYVPIAVPVSFFAGIALVTGIAWLVNPEFYVDPGYHLLAGGAMLGGWFMVTDMTTSPMSLPGRIVFAGFAGLLTGVIRLADGFPEGVSYSILIMNAMVPVIDRHFKPRRFGAAREHADAGSTKGAAS